MAPWLAALADGGRYEVELVEIDDRKAVFGTVESVDQTSARARISGTVQTLSIDEGDAVRAGLVVAVVADPKLPLQIAALDASLRALASERDLASTEVDRARTLRTRQAIAQSVLDDAVTRLQVNEAKLAATQAERAVVAEQLAEGEVLAPTAGRVLQVHVTEGTVVLPGEIIATLAVERYVLRIELPERHARFIEEGDPVEIAGRGVGACGTSLRDGRVRQVYPRLDNGRVVADVEAEGLGDFFVGERTCVFVSTGKRQTIVVPAKTLTLRFGVAYARVEGVGEVVVQPGQTLPDGVEILSGLRAGDVLLLP